MGDEKQGKLIKRQDACIILIYWDSKGEHSGGAFFIFSQSKSMNHQFVGAD